MQYFGELSATPSELRTVSRSAVFQFSPSPRGKRKTEIQQKGERELKASLSDVEGRTVASLGPVYWNHRIYLV